MAPRTKRRSEPVLWQVEMTVTRRESWLIEATDGEDAKEKARRGDYVEVFGLPEMVDWRLVGEPTPDD